MNNFIYNYILSDIGRVLWDSFENHPEEWETCEDGYTIDNHSKEISLWIGNGQSFFNGYRYFSTSFLRENKYQRKNPAIKIKLGIIERQFLYRKCCPLIKILETESKVNIIERFKE